MFDNQILLITGGTGSFGKTVLKRFLDTSVKEIRVFSRDEKKQEDLRIALNSPKLKFYIGDVRDISSLKSALLDVDYVFHAAALKQVPSCEFYPMEAVKTNIIGTENVLNESIYAGVKKVIVLSTDKAVYPINAMGMTKALSEKVMISKSSLQGSSASTILCATRYGNVMASRGSVIPLFIDQILNDKPLTITDPCMTRFLMTLDQSVDLVLYAFEHGRQGDIFVQKSPASTIAKLAQSISIFMEKPNHQIIEIGTRHGEKLYETLISCEEMIRASDLGSYFCIPSDNRDLNYATYFSEGKPEISQITDYTSHNTDRLDVPEILNLLNSLSLR